MLCLVWYVGDIVIMMLGNIGVVGGVWINYDQFFLLFVFIEFDLIKCDVLVCSYLQLQGLLFDVLLVNGFLLVGFSWLYNQQFGFMLQGVCSSLLVQVSCLIMSCLGSNFNQGDLVNMFCIEQCFYLLFVSYQLMLLFGMLLMVLCQEILGDNVNQKMQLNSFMVSWILCFGLWFNLLFGVCYSCFEGVMLYFENVVYVNLI